MSLLKKNLNNLKDKLKNIQVQIDENTSDTAIKAKKEVSMADKVKEIKSDSEIININIGGELFATRKETLLKDPDCLFAILLKGEFKDKELPLSINSFNNNNTKNEVRELFFDRSADYFPYILDYLRTGIINYNLFSKLELKALHEEATFYEVTDIRDYLEERTKQIIPISFKLKYIFITILK